MYKLRPVLQSVAVVSSLCLLAAFVGYRVVAARRHAPLAVRTDEAAVLPAPTADWSQIPPRTTKSAAVVTPTDLQRQTVMFSGSKSGPVVAPEPEEEPPQVVLFSTSKSGPVVAPSMVKEREPRPMMSGSKSLIIDWKGPVSTPPATLPSDDRSELQGFDGANMSTPFWVSYFWWVNQGRSTTRGHR